MGSRRELNHGSVVRHIGLSCKLFHFYQTVRTAAIKFRTMGKCKYERSAKVAPENDL